MLSQQRVLLGFSRFFCLLVVLFLGVIKDTNLKFDGDVESVMQVNPPLKMCAYQWLFGVTRANGQNSLLL